MRSEVDEIYGHCELCAKDIGRIGTVLQRCYPCQTFGFVQAGGTNHPPIPESEWDGYRWSRK